MQFPFVLPNRYGPPTERRSGGQGQVFICTDSFLERQVAIKFIDARLYGSEIQKEIAGLSDIRSRHVVEIYDLVRSKKDTWIGIVQTFVSGPDLKEFALQGHNEMKLLRVLWQVASGICDIHVAGKVHRDIKPNNVRLDSEEVVRILDFGLTTAADSDTMQARGTAYFMAPELNSIAPVKVTAAMDTYAFGVLVWFLTLKGQLPVALKEQPPMNTRRLPSFSESSLTLHEGLVELLDRTLLTDPSKRPSMLEVRDELARRILFGTHNISLINRDKVQTIGKVGDVATLRAGRDSISVHYDGLYFGVTNITGDAYINNIRAELGQRLPDSCVVTLGSRELGFGRTFVPVDMSHPGVGI